MTDLRLQCEECQCETVLRVRDQLEILSRMKRPAIREIIECHCGKYQWALAKRTAIAK